MTTHDAASDDANTTDRTHSDARQKQISPVDTRSGAPAGAPAPAAPAAASYIGVLCAAGMVALGAVGIRDGITAAGWVHGRLWTRTSVHWLHGQTFHGWMVPVGVIAVLLGLSCVIVAVKPRRKRAVILAARTSVHLNLSDTARLAAAAARAVPGVIDATARARKSTVTVRARTTGADPSGQRSAIVRAVEQALAPLAKSPRIRVRTSIGGRS